MNAQTFRDVLAEDEAAKRALDDGNAEPYKALWSAPPMRARPAWRN